MMVRGMGAVVKEVHVNEQGQLVMKTDNEEDSRLFTVGSDKYLGVEVSEKEVAEYMQEAFKRVKNQRVL